MREWVVIASAGAFGGIVAVLVGEMLSLLRAVDINRAGSPSRGWLTPGVRWMLILLLNALGAAVASYLLWATYTSSITFESRSFTPAEVAASIIVGLSGTGALQGYMHERGTVSKWKIAAEDSASASEVLALSEEEQDTGIEDDSNDRSEDAHHS
jgi:hypothetical protein